MLRCTLLGQTVSQVAGEGTPWLRPRAPCTALASRDEVKRLNSKPNQPVHQISAKTSRTVLSSTSESMTSTKKESLNYQSLVKEAIVSLKERNGSSPQAIAKYLESSSEHKDKLPQNFR